MKRQKIRKAIIAAAGFGTRFLPQTKAMPKEMLPLVDKPIIQHIVEELVAAGIEDIVIVTGYHKRSLEDHFDHTSADLRANLKKAGKQQLLNEIRQISQLANFAYIRQKGPYGNATPLMNAEHLIGDEPFVYTFADDFVEAQPSRFSQLLEAYEVYGGIILTCVRRQADADYSRYAYVGGKQHAPNVTAVGTIIEKPGTAAAAPSDLASVSGYVFEPSIFGYLHQDAKQLSAGEFIMQPALQRMIADGLAVYGCEIQDGRFYDTGDKLEYLKTVFDFALKRDDIGPELSAYLRQRLP